jgi:hypothetical protein
MSVGRKSNYDVTFLTGRRVYRSGITSADAGPDAVSDDIRLDIDSSKMVQNSGSVSYEASSRGYNGHLKLFIEFDPPEDGCLGEVRTYSTRIAANSDVCHADILVWVWSGPHLSSYAGTAPDPIQGSWCLVDARSVTCDALINLTDLPAARYRVTVGFVTDGASVTVIEQHTE